MLYQRFTLQSTIHKWQCLWDTSTRWSSTTAIIWYCAGEDRGWNCPSWSSQWHNTKRQGRQWFYCLFSRDYRLVYEYKRRLMTGTQKDIAIELASKVERYLQIPLLRRDKCYLHYWKHDEKFLLLKYSDAKYLFTSIRRRCTPITAMFWSKSARRSYPKKRRVAFVSPP